MNRNYLLIAALVLMTSFVSQAQRVAVVDVNSILENLTDYQAAQNEIDQLTAKWRQEIAQEYDKINSMYNKLQAEQVLLSNEVKIEREEEIISKEKEVREMQKSKFGPEGALFKKRQSLVNPVQEKVYAAIEDYADDKGYDFIFDKGGASGILFSNDRYDKTKDILSRLGVEE